MRDLIIVIVEQVDQRFEFAFRERVFGATHTKNYKFIAQTTQRDYSQFQMI